MAKPLDPIDAAEAVEDIQFGVAMMLARMPGYQFTITPDEADAIAAEVGVVRVEMTKTRDSVTFRLVPIDALDDDLVALVLYEGTPT